MRRLILGLVVALFPLVALAQPTGGGIDIVEISGPLDASAMRFLVDSIEDAAATGQELVILQVNSPAALDTEALAALVRLVAMPPLPVAVWVGPAPASALGGVAQLVLAAPQRAIAPGGQFGLATPTVAGDPEAALLVDPMLLESFKQKMTAEDTGLELQPAIRQYIQDLDGRIFPTDHGDVEVATIEPFSANGETGVTTKQVTFIEPGLGLRFLRLGVTPEAAFFFLIVGLTVVSFEFFAIGPGVAAGVASLAILIGGWGMVNLPVRWWALAMVVAGWALLTGSHQRGGVIMLTFIGAVMLQVGGMVLVDGSGQIDARWWLILISVIAVLFFFLLAMPTVQRARFSTRALGRESLVGAPGVALVDFDPDGVVEVRGARWRGTAHREAGLVEGSPVVVIGVDGMFLEVSPVEEEMGPGNREN